MKGENGWRWGRGNRQKQTKIKSTKKKWENALAFYVAEEKEAILWTRTHSHTHTHTHHTHSTLTIPLFNHIDHKEDTLLGGGVSWQQNSRCLSDMALVQISQHLPQH